MALLVVGVGLWLAGEPAAADRWWAAGTVVALVPAVAWVVSALRRGRAGVDLVAVLSLVGTLAVHEYLAGSLIALMLATGRALETAAERRASRDLKALLERAPRTARRRVDELVQTVPLAEVEPGDLLVVAPGEVVPVDGVVERDGAVLDESALTGESLETEMAAGGAVRSGVVTQARRSSCGRPRRRRRAHMRGSCGWPARPARTTPQWFAWLTATRRGSCPSRSGPPHWPGW